MRSFVSECVGGIAYSSMAQVLLATTVELASVWSEALCIAFIASVALTAAAACCAYGYVCADILARAFLHGHFGTFLCFLL